MAVEREASVESYRAQAARAFEVLAEGLAPFVDARMTAAYPGEDWILLAANKLGKRPDVLVSLSDPHFQLEVINRWWGPAFAPAFPPAQAPGLRQTVTDLRTARNHWAHPDEDHPFDFDYALRVHQAAEEMLHAIRSPQAGHVAELTEHLRWDSVRAMAVDQGISEADSLMRQLARLQEEHSELSTQLDEARNVAQSATGRSRAFSRQLAELQTQYAAVAGLRDSYQTLQSQLEDARALGEDTAQDTSTVRAQLASAEMALVGLQKEGGLLRDQLSYARRSIALIDPVETEAGRRWIWLMSVLILLLGVLVVVAYYLGRADVGR
jgi:hypothetical protein